LNCPNSFELPQCKHIVNCRTATQEEYAKASFQFNTAMPPNLSHVLLSWLIALPDFRPESEGVTEQKNTIRFNMLSGGIATATLVPVQQ